MLLNATNAYRKYPQTDLTTVDYDIIEVENEAWLTRLAFAEKYYILNEDTCNRQQNVIVARERVSLKLGCAKAAFPEEFFLNTEIKVSDSMFSMHSNRTVGLKEN